MSVLLLAFVLGTEPNAALAAAWSPPKPTPSLLAAWAVPASPAAAAMPTVQQKVRAKGWHIHTCPYCQTRVSHEDTHKGDEAAHTCPNPDCRKVYPLPWYPSETGVRLVERQVPGTSVPVPNAVTPTVTKTVVPAAIPTAAVAPFPTYSSGGFMGGPSTCPGGNCPPQTAWPEPSGRIFPRLFKK